VGTFAKKKLPPKERRDSAQRVRERREGKSVTSRHFAARRRGEKAEGRSGDIEKMIKNRRAGGKGGGEYCESWRGKKEKQTSCALGGLEKSKKSINSFHPPDLGAPDFNEERKVWRTIC